MTKFLTFTIISLLCATNLLWAQPPESFKYQAIIRGTDGNTISQKSANIRISIIQGMPSGPEVYQEIHDTQTNTYGVISLNIGDGQIQSGNFSNINWGDNSYYINIKAEVDKSGNELDLGTMQLLSVPYAFYAKTAGNAFSGDYLDLKNRPDFLNWDTNVSDDFSGDYKDLTNQPDFSQWDKNASDDFSGDYKDLINRPNFAKVATTNSYNDLTDRPDFTDWDKNAADDFSGNYNDLLNKPTLSKVAASNDYNDLDNRPDFSGWDTKADDDFSGKYNDLSGKPELATVATSGKYTDLKDKPAKISDLTLDANNSKITNLASPKADMDAANKAYVDALEKRISELERLILADKKVQDRDGNQYGMVKIGHQIWMSENLKSTHYADGTEIADTRAYNNDESLVNTYGRMYTWDAALKGMPGSNSVPSKIQGACPDGWHIPSQQEWDILLDQLGGMSKAGGKMREVGTIRWEAPNIGATNESAFTALPGGGMDPAGNFAGINKTAFFWTTYRENDSFAYSIQLSNNLNQIGNQVRHKKSTFSIRCIKDTNY